MGHPRRWLCRRVKLGHTAENSVVPPGLESFLRLFPALKRWARLVRPSGAGLPCRAELSWDGHGRLSLHKQARLLRARRWLAVGIFAGEGARATRLAGCTITCFGVCWDG